jgi:hypothetical protein
MLSINDIITYILSYIFPAVKRDLHLQTIIENQIIEDDDDLMTFLEN